MTTMKLTSGFGGEVVVEVPCDSEGSVNALMRYNEVEVEELRKSIISGETDPNSKDPRRQSGAKTDNGKIMLGLLEDFPLALAAVADAATYGATGKYCRGSWRDIPDAANRCRDARVGHYLKARVERFCPHTNLFHLGQACWNGLVELEATIAADPKLTAKFLERIATTKPQPILGDVDASIR